MSLLYLKTPEEGGKLIRHAEPCSCSRVLSSTALMGWAVQEYSFQAGDKSTGIEQKRRKNTRRRSVRRKLPRVPFAGDENHHHLGHFPFLLSAR